MEWQAPSNTTGLALTSIIIPVHNWIALTKDCLGRFGRRSVLRGEIIVVDDASTDDTAAELGRWAQLEPRLKIVRNDANAGFLTSAMRGAGAATGEILLFLNNDTVPLRGWLPPLLRVFRDCPGAGAAGGKLIFPDGTLQEAGGMIFSDGLRRTLDAVIINSMRRSITLSGKWITAPPRYSRRLANSSKG